MRKVGDSPDDDLRIAQYYWDGVIAKTYTPKNNRGTISSSKPSQTILTPFDATWLRTEGAEHGPYLEYTLMRDPPPAVTRVQDEAGKGLLVVESADGRQRIWLDPSRNLLLVKAESLYRQDTSSSKPQESIAAYTYVIEESEEVVSGLWIPTKWKRIRRIGPPSAREHWGKVSVIASCKVDLLEVNKDYPEETFTFEFPMGTTVHDQIAGTLYQQGAVTGSLAQISLSDALESPVESSGAGDGVEASQSGRAVLPSPEALTKNVSLVAFWCTSLSQWSPR